MLLRQFGQQPYSDDYTQVQWNASQGGYDAWNELLKFQTELKTGDATLFDGELHRGAQRVPRRGWRDELSEPNRSGAGTIVLAPLLFDPWNVTSQTSCVKRQCVTHDA